MAQTPEVAIALLRTGLLLGTVLLLQFALTRHLPVETIPHVLKSRVDMSNRLRPWLFATATAMTIAGVLLQLS